MFVSRTINADHKDLIHDVAFDFYGKRMATCSSDQSVKIWDQGEDGQWTCTANWKCHSGSVWKVSWGHPEFGPLIATCSFDRSVSVWEEIVGDLNSFEKGQSHWVKRGNLVDSRTSVNDVRFGPRHLGMLLACCSSDGIVRIFEASDVLMLSQWSLISEFNCKMSCSCLDWSQSKMHPPMIAVGSDDNNPNNGGKVMIFECVDNNKKWMRVETIMSIVEPVYDIAFAPTLGRSYHMLAVASKDVSVVLLRPTEESSSSQGYSRFEIREVGKFDDHNATIWRVSWNITGTIFASSGDDGCIRLWKANYLDKWRCIAVIRGESGSLLSDISFIANTMGNSIKH